MGCIRFFITANSSVVSPILTSSVMLPKLASRST